MTTDLHSLYQDLIIDHSRRPRNAGRLPEANRHAEGYNPLCGDRLEVHLEVRAGVIAAASFEGTGCAISLASASLMTEALKGKSVAQAEALAADFRGMVTGQPTDAAAMSQLGKLEVLAGVREFPTRVKCATLAWHTCLAALHAQAKPVTTEDDRTATTE